MAACPQMSMGPAAASHDMAGMDMSAMGMAGMDMSGMEMGDAAAADDAKAPAQPAHPGDHGSNCQYDCCTGGLISHIAPLTAQWAVPAPLSWISQTQRAVESCAQVHTARARLRPAIRAPPLSA